MHILRQNKDVSAYNAKFTELVVKIPPMTPEKQMYLFIRGLKSVKSAVRIVKKGVELQDSATLV